MTPSCTDPAQDSERYLAAVFDELTSAPTQDSAIRSATQAANVLAGTEGLCLVTAEGDRCPLALTHRPEIYSCDLRSTELYRSLASLQRTAAASSRTLWGKQHSIALSTGEQQAVGVALLVPLEVATGRAAVAFFWLPGHTIDPQRTRQLELLAKALGLTATMWRKNDENTAQHRASADLQHRLRNSLALMRSIVRRSRATAESAEHFAMHLEARIGALARTQAALAVAGGAGVDLEELIRTELLASAAPRQRCLVQGPQVRLHTKGTESLALAVHELATNSLKFGALAASSGELAITWSVASDPPRLQLSWIESGVTVASVAPRRRGFGQELIECTLPYELGARARFNLSPGGMCCAIEIPLDACASSVEPAADQAARGGGSA